MVNNEKVKAFARRSETLKRRGQSGKSGDLPRSGVAEPEQVARRFALQAHSKLPPSS
jgi:hypothetical protein